MFDVTRAELARHTTLRLGGPAGRLVAATDRDAVVDAVRPRGAPPLVLAGGSNVVISDDGFPGTVVLVRTAGIEVDRSGDEVLLRVESGQPWDEVAAFAVAEGLVGIECLAGIPGSTGATPIQNVGAYGQEVAETIADVLVYDRRSGQQRRLPPGQCRFAYRTSVFRHNPRYVVLAVTLRLRAGRQSNPVRYAELARALGVPVGGCAPLAAVRAAVLALRTAKGMVLDPADPDTFSVGSFFTNPVLDQAGYAEVCERARRMTGGEPVGWPGEHDTIKVSAAWLIERAGFAKGYPGGQAGVAISGKHTLALTNRGTGSTAALLGLARDIRDGVRKAFEVELRPEPVLVNCEL